MANAGTMTIAGGLLCSALNGAAGSISCIWNKRNKFFEDDPSLMELLESFRSTVTNSDVPEYKMFSEALNQHVHDTRAAAPTPAKPKKLNYPHKAASCPIPQLGP
jgi:hypothetical protein